MSRVRTRPTRDDTCEKLFEAAAQVFEEQGIGGASIETIAASYIPSPAGTSAVRLFNLSPDTPAAGLAVVSRRRRRCRHRPANV